jgi:multidrug resistance efflux pump
MTDAARQLRRIRPPLRRVLSDAARRIGIAVVWLAAAAAAVWLWTQSPDQQSVVAVAETVEYPIAADTTARILDVTVEPGQTVRAGELLVVLDPAPLTRTIEVYAAELERRNGELLAEAAILGHQRLVEERSFAAAVDSAEVELLRARVDADAARAELAGVRAQERRWEALVAQRVAPRDELERLRAQRDVLTRQLATRDRAARAFEDEVEDARARLAAFQASAAPGDAGPSAGGQDILGGRRGEVAVARAQLGELESQRQRLVLRAPADAVVQQILLRAGSVATPGEPLVLLRGSAPRRVFAYVDDARAERLRPGARVQVHGKGGNLAPLPGRVTGLSAGVTPYPLQLQANANQNLWGREVVIELEPGVDSPLVPGQRLAVTFDELLPGPGALRVAAAAQDAGPSREPDAPGALVVPSALKRQTRVEPSGIAWSATHGAYLVASDDTGWPDTTEHAPWLLLLHPDGTFAPDPVVVGGVAALNDLEALAWMDDGRLLLLSSQSVSKKGKRSRARTQLVAVEIASRGLRATHVVSLADALADRPDPAWHTALGLAAPRGKGRQGVDAALDIEGLAVRGGAALLGLKAPRDPQGRALVWRLDALDRFLASGRLAPDQLRLHARLRLADGAEPTGAGISDLLALPDGGLLVLSCDDPDGAAGTRRVGGAAWLVPAGAVPNAEGELPVQLVRRFDGVTPEGAALAPGGDRIYVVFDRGAQTPFAATLPLPTAAASSVAADPLASW